MRIKYDQIRPQIDELLASYSGLKEEDTENNSSIILIGRISINRSYNSFTIDNEYDVKILIPLNNDDLPDVWDIGDKIALCFYNGYSLLQWMKNIVEPYYYSYEYYTRYGEFPFGDRGHNLVGVIETYQQIFNEDNVAKTYKLLRAISQRKYKGHLPCPCGSAIITRKCHGKSIFPFINDDYLFSIANRDYLRICEAIREYDKQSED